MRTCYIYDIYINYFKNQYKYIILLKLLWHRSK
jgi:hypothetical protein